MKKLAKLILIAACALTINTASAKVMPLKNCKQLQAPKSVLLVHASWCSYCKRYIPTYEQVSNRKDMKDYKFYILRNDNSRPVCGQYVRNVPTTIVGNMSSKKVGAMSYGSLINFIKHSA